MVDVKAIALGVLVLLVLVVAFVPVISQNISVADDQRKCTTLTHPYECLDNDDGLLNWCTNETSTNVHCLNATTPIYNTSAQLCTNSSGVSVVNNSPVSVCDSIRWDVVDYTDTGLTSTEVALLGLLTLFIIIGVIFGIVKSSGLMK